MSGVCVERGSDRPRADTQVAPGRALSLPEGEGREVSHGFAVTGFQHSTQPLDTDDLTVVPVMLRLNGPVDLLSCGYCVPDGFTVGPVLPALAIACVPSVRARPVRLVFG